MQRRRGPNADPVSEDDILRAIGKLKALGSGFTVIKVAFCRFTVLVPWTLLNSWPTLPMSPAQRKHFAPACCCGFHKGVWECGNSKT